MIVILFLAFVEVLLFFGSIILTAVYLFRWYKYTLSSNPIKRGTFSRILLAFLPVASFVIILYTLQNLASFDVVGSAVYIVMYLMIGLVWFYFGVFLMFAFFDVSWVDDALNMNNPAAALAVVGGGLGVTIIYAGSNIGDGPGWWCVFFAGGLGLTAWFALGVLANLSTRVFKRITVGRSMACAIRTCAYLISSGIVLGRASAGDWTSFGKTVIEFLDGWPVLIITAAFILIELIFVTGEKRGEQGKAIGIILSLIFGAAYIAVAIYALQVLPPLPVNPMYEL